MKHAVFLISGEQPVELVETLEVPFDQMPPVNGLPVALGEVVEHYRVVAGGGQFLYKVAADIARTACYQKRHVQFRE